MVTNSSAPNSTTPCTTGTSWVRTAVSDRRPIPGRENTVSTMIAPASRLPKVSPARVRAGSTALRSTSRQTTWCRRYPLAAAVVA